MEQQAHLEASANSDDLTVATQHRTIYRWLTKFISLLPAKLEADFHALRAGANGHDAPQGGSDYMAPDGSDDTLNETD